MPKYEVLVFLLHSEIYEVEADSREEAKRDCLLYGEAIDGTFEYVESLTDSRIKELLKNDGDLLKRHRSMQVNLK